MCAPKRLRVASVSRKVARADPRRWSASADPVCMAVAFGTDRRRKCRHVGDNSRGAPYGVECRPPDASVGSHHCPFDNGASQTTTRSRRPIRACRWPSRCGLRPPDPRARHAGVGPRPPDRLDDRGNVCAQPASELPPVHASGTLRRPSAHHVFGGGAFGNLRRVRDDSIPDVGHVHSPSRCRRRIISDDDRAHGSIWRRSARENEAPPDPSSYRSVGGRRATLPYNDRRPGSAQPKFRVHRRGTSSIVFWPTSSGGCVSDDLDGRILRPYRAV